MNAIKRLIIVLLGFMLQFGSAIMIRLYFYEHVTIINLFYTVLSVSIVLSILKDSTKLSKDVPWIILILLFPIFGTVFYITLGRNYSRNKLLRRIFKVEDEYDSFLIQDSKINNEIEKSDMDNLKYIINRAGCPVSCNNEVTYYNFGEKFYPELLKELKKAKKFIFLEYFIINKGKMWNGILDILKEKAAQGLDVRVLYDDMGSLGMLSPKFPKELNSFGIKCIAFNELSPFKGIFMNNRDHRKMTIIDGRVAFSGGVNLSDEYINLISRFGVWKDNGIKVVGHAVWNMTVMFLTMWNANNNEDKNILKFKYDFKDKIKPDGYTAPFGVAPLHRDLIGEDVYLNIINSSKKYLYIMTPYLIIDTDMINSLLRASKRGVDIKIIVPGIPDKKIVYSQTKSYFKTLIEGGVKIYKYKKGFVHSKVILSDDIRGVVGTINLDYRSLYLHFENGIYMENVSELNNIKEDFDNTLDDSKEQELEIIKPGILKNIGQGLLRLFAPLL